MAVVPLNSLRYIIKQDSCVLQLKVRDLHNRLKMMQNTYKTSPTQLFPGSPQVSVIMSNIIVSTSVRC